MNDSRPERTAPLCAVPPEILTSTTVVDQITQNERDIEGFFTYLETIRQLSKNTMRAYRTDLARFRSFLSGRGTPLGKASTADIRAYVRQLVDAGSCAQSVNRYLSQVRTFYRYMVIVGRVAVSPAKIIPRQRERKMLPNVLTEEECRKLVEVKGTSFCRVRDRALLEIMYSTGGRVGEIVGAGVASVDEERRTIRVVGKGGRERLVYVGGEARKALISYLEIREKRLDRYAAVHGEPFEDAGTALFLSNRNHRLTERGAFFAVVARARKVLPGREIGCHTLRHSFATHLMNHGAGIRTVQELLGHANVTTTQIYVHVAVDRTREEYRLAHPHAGRVTNLGQKEKQNEIAS